MIQRYFHLRELLQRAVIDKVYDKKEFFFIKLGKSKPQSVIDNDSIKPRLTNKIQYKRKSVLLIFIINNINLTHIQEKENATNK